jgi:hypothetical protein
LKNLWVIEEIEEENLKSVEPYENKSRTYQNLWDSTKAVVRGKCVAMSTYIKNEKFQIYNLIMHAKFLKKQEQAKPRISRWK